MGNLLDSEPATFEEASKHQCWRDAMTEEYESILKNDVWDIVPRPEGKSIVTSKWIFKIKHATDESVEKWIMMRLLHVLLGLHLFIRS